MKVMLTETLLIINTFCIDSVRAVFVFLYGNNKKKNHCFSEKKYFIPFNDNFKEKCTIIAGKHTFILII